MHPSQKAEEYTTPALAQKPCRTTLGSDSNFSGLRQVGGFLKWVVFEHAESGIDGRMKLKAKEQQSFGIRPRPPDGSEY